MSSIRTPSDLTIPPWPVAKIVDLDEFRRRRTGGIAATAGAAAMQSLLHTRRPDLASLIEDQP